MCYNIKVTIPNSLLHNVEFKYCKNRNNVSPALLYVIGIIFWQTNRLFLLTFALLQKVVSFPCPTVCFPCPTLCFPCPTVCFPCPTVCDWNYFLTDKSTLSSYFCTLAKSSNFLSKKFPFWLFFFSFSGTITTLLGK